MAVVRCMGVFYEYDYMIGYRDPEFLQGIIHVFIGLSRRVGLVANVKKYTTITCHPGAIFTGISEEAFIRRGTGEGGKYREHLRRRIPCPYFKV